MMISDQNGNLNILIIDDLPQNIQILGNILKQENYSISYSQSGKAALAQVKSNKIDLILLDIMMPQMDGFEVCEILKNDPDTQDIPIIFLTARTDTDSIVKGFQLGAQDYVTKPFSAEELLARVKTHLALKRQSEQLKSVNERLEKKVSERTTQLSEANKQLKTLEKAKNDFLSIISHELRTPLNGIIGLTDLINDVLKSTDNEAYVEYLKEASNRLVNFSETAILITSLRADKYKVSFSPQKVFYIVENALENVDEKLKMKNVSVKLTIDPEDLQVNADFDLIKTCFTNILDNAVKFSPRNDVILMNCYSEKDHIVIDFIDNGKGFKETAKSNLFQFFSSDDVTHIEGVGLSLAATKLIMDAHNGSIDLDRAKGAGAKVTLTLPV